MIKIEAILDKDGVLRACKAEGHAGAGKTGTDIVCAAVSVLLRTALITLSNRKGVVVRGGAPKSGQLWLEADYDTDGKDFLFACGVFLLDGLGSIEQEYPKNCSLNIIVFIFFLYWLYIIAKNCDKTWIKRFAINCNI